MQFAIGLAQRARELAMHRADSLEREPVAVQRSDNFRGCAAIAADDTFIRCVRDEEIDVLAFCDGGAHRVRRTVHHAGDPFRPARQVAREERRITQPIQHFVALPPHAQREQRGGFAEAVADRGIRPDAEVRRKVRDHAAEADLAADQGAMVGESLGGQRAVPELVRVHLAGEPRIVLVLPAQDFRPLQREFAAHAGKLVARAGKHEGDPPRGLVINCF